MEEQRIIHRINRTIGQLEGIKKEIIKEDYDCEQVVMQIKAVMGSVKGLGKAFAEADLDRCFHDKVTEAQKEKKLKTLIDTAFDL